MTPARTVVVTGATGFLGRHVAGRLAADGHRVRALVRGRARVPGVAETFGYAGLDDPAGMAAALAGAEVVVHLAARVHVMRETAGDPLAEHRRVNVEGTAALLAEAVRAGVRRFVHASTVKAVGEGDGTLWTEETPPAPAEPYGISKLEAERLVLERCAEHGTEAVVLRLPLAYGPGMRGNMLRLFSLIDRGLPLPFGRVRNRRSLLYAGNFAAAVAAVVAAGSAGRGVYFLTDGRDVSTPELMRAIATALGRPARLLPVPQRAFAAAGRIGDVVARVVPCPLTTAAVERLVGSLAVDPGRFRRDFGFEPPFSPDEGLRATAQWYRARGGAGAAGSAPAPLPEPVAPGR